MKNIQKDTRAFIVRFWIFQKERMPLYGVLIMAGVTAGVVYNFSHEPLRNYLTAVSIIALYLIQIRTADERKDFEHDNKYHKTRPVQRGIITLNELNVLNKLSIISQLLLYASFGNMHIFLLGLLSQGYAQLTSKEFFVRDWIRKHFFTYYISHYVQLVIVFYAITTIIRPSEISYWLFVAFFMLGVISTELGRKMYPVEDDTTDDTYSAQLGHKGSAAALITMTTAMTLTALYFIYTYPKNPLLIVGPVLAWGFVINSAYHYAIEPNRKNAKLVEQAANIMYVVSMLSVIIGS